MRKDFKPEQPNENPQNFQGATSASKKINKLIFAALVFIAVCLAVFFYWLVSNQDVLEVRNAPVPVSKVSPSPEVDGQVVFRVDFCKNVEAEGRVRPSFVSNAKEVFIPTYTDKSDKGCQLYDVPVIIPRDLTPGKYHVHYRITYKVNPIKTVVEEFDSQEFTIQ
jgi:hypothetical protein